MTAFCLSKSTSCLLCQLILQSTTNSIKSFQIDTFSFQNRFIRPIITTATQQQQQRTNVLNHPKQRPSSLYPLSSTLFEDDDDDIDINLIDDDHEFEIITSDSQNPSSQHIISAVPTLTTPTTTPTTTQKKRRYHVGRRGYNKTLLSECHNDLHLYSIAFEKQQWSNRLIQLRDFQSEYGHCRVPLNYNRYKQRLGRWVTNVRRQKRDNELIQDRIDELDSIGFDWNDDPKRSGGLYRPHLWEGRLRQLKKFKETYGHLDVPRVFGDNQKLANWVWTQRYQYKRFLEGQKSFITEERIEELETLGFDFSYPRKRGGREGVLGRVFEEEWNTEYNKVKKMGTGGVYDIWDVIKNDEKLATWIHSQRMQLINRTACLNSKRMNLLNAINFEWDMQDGEKEFFSWMAIDSNSNNSSNNDDNNNNTTIINSQKITAATTITPSSPLDTSSSWLAAEISWWQTFHSLQHSLLHNENNIIRLPSHLKKWLQNQQTSFELILSTGRPSQTLSEEKHVALDTSGMLFSPSTSSLLDHEAEWQDMYRQLRRYKRQYGDCKVPRTKATHRKLGVWVYNQRMQYKLMKRKTTKTKTTTTTSCSAVSLTKRRIEALEGLGFEWFVDAPVEDEGVGLMGVVVGGGDGDGDDEKSSSQQHPLWLANYEKLREYKERVGDCLIPMGYEADPQLGNWVHLQRQRYRLAKVRNNHYFTKEQLILLDKIDLEWDVQNMDICRMSFQSQFDKKVEELRQYKSKHGHCNVPMEYGTYYELSTWVKNQRLFYDLRQRGKDSLLTDDRVKALIKVGFDFDYYDDGNDNEQQFHDDDDGGGGIDDDDDEFNEDDGWNMDAEENDELSWEY